MQVNQNKNGTYQIFSIGQVSRSNGVVSLKLKNPYRPGLKQLKHFGYVIVLWWADRVDDDERRKIMPVSSSLCRG